MALHLPQLFRFPAAQFCKQEQTPSDHPRSKQSPLTSQQSFPNSQQFPAGTQAPPLRHSQQPGSPGGLQVPHLPRCSQARTQIAPTKRSQAPSRLRSPSLPPALFLRKKDRAGAPRSRLRAVSRAKGGPKRARAGRSHDPGPDCSVLYITLGFWTGRGAATLRTGTEVRGSPARSRLSRPAPAPCGRGARIALHLAPARAPSPRTRPSPAPPPPQHRLITSLQRALWSRSLAASRSRSFLLHVPGLGTQGPRRIKGTPDLLFLTI